MSKVECDVGVIGNRCISKGAQCCITATDKYWRVQLRSSHISRCTPLDSYCGRLAGSVPLRVRLFWIVTGPHHARSVSDQREVQAALHVTIDLM